MIGDGCGYNQILATDYYQYGKEGSQPYESFPVRLGMSNFPAKLSDSGVLIDPKKGYLPDSAWSGFSYMLKGWTDSAPGASTLACGKKTYNGAVGVDINHKPLYSITQRAKDNRKSAGVVTTVQWSHATPAGFAAHNVSRSNYSQIAREMILDSKLDVIMGCGNPDYDDNSNRPSAPKDYQYVGGKACWDSLLSGAVRFSEPSNAGNYTARDVDADGYPDPWTLIQDRKDFKALEDGKTPKRVIGVATVRSTLQQLRKGKTDTLPFAIPLNTIVPTLTEMALGALNVLDNNPEGFFLMIEGGAIDWANHDNQKTRMIEEEAGFNATVSAVIQWIESHGGWENTLLVITADHESGYLTGPKPKDNSPLRNPVVNLGRNKVPGMKYNTTDHTNQLVPFFAKGKGSELYNMYAVHTDPVRGKYMDNTDVAKIFFQLWPLK